MPGAWAPAGPWPKCRLPAGTHDWSKFLKPEELRSFLADQLPRGADVISLVRVCFDHPDERVLKLLKAVRRALPDDVTELMDALVADPAKAAEAIWNSLRQ